MILKHLIEDLNSIIAQSNEYDPTNVTSIEYAKGQILFECGQEEIEELKSKLKDNEDILIRYEEEARQSVSANASLENRIAILEEALCDFKIASGGTAKDLIEKVFQAQQAGQDYRLALIEFQHKYGEIQLENEKLRARKNKATVERCRITGKLVAEFDGVKYTLEQTK